MDRKETEEYLENIKVPVPPLPEQKEILKIALLNARKSSAIGVVLVGLPALLIVLTIVQNALNLNLGITHWIDRGTSSLPVYTRAVLFFIFIAGFPLIAVVLNILSITYFQYDRVRKEFNFTIKMRWWNIMITLAGAGLASFYILHLLADSLLGGR